MLPKPRTTLDEKIANKVLKYAWKSKRYFSERRREVKLPMYLIFLDQSLDKSLKFTGAISVIHEVLPSVKRPFLQSDIKKSTIIWVFQEKAIVNNLGYTPNTMARLCPHFNPEGEKFLKALKVLEFMCAFPDEYFEGEKIKISPPNPEVSYFIDTNFKY